MSYFRNTCPLCRSKRVIKKHNRVRDSNNIKVLFCENCTLTFLSDFSLGSEENNRNSSMHGYKNPDLKNWTNATYVDDFRRYQFLKKKINNKRILDFGCGNGGFIDITVKNVKKIHGYEIDKKTVEFLKQKKIKVHSEFSEIEIKYDFITAFHVFEHLNDPIDVLRELSKLLDLKGEIIIEIPNSNDALIELYACKKFKDFTYWSQHLFLYNESTIKRLIKKANMKINWIEHIQRYPLENHLHWLQSGKPGGHEISNIKFPDKIKKSYENFLKETKLTDTIIFGIGN